MITDQIKSIKFMLHLRWTGSQPYWFLLMAAALGCRPLLPHPLVIVVLGVDEALALFGNY